MRRVALLTIPWLALRIGGTGFWLRAQRRQYALNRKRRGSKHTLITIEQAV
jgi:hypothetical protein